MEVIYEKKIIITFYNSFLSSSFAGKNSTVIRTFEKKFPQDKFYFIQGLDYKFDLNTSIRYRTDFVQRQTGKLGYPFGLELGILKLKPRSEYLENYEVILKNRSG